MATDRQLDEWLTRFDNAKNRADQWQSMFNEAYEYAIPNQNTFYAGDARAHVEPGEKMNARVYDTTLVKATNIFTSKLHSILTPPFMQWAKLTTSDQVPPQLKEQIDEDLQVATNILFNHINESNFDLAINESYYDLSVGTGALTVTEGTDEMPLIFNSVPISHVFPEKGPHGTIKTVWRLFEQVPGRNVQQLWPDAKLSPTMMEKIEDNYSIEFSFIEGTVYNPNENNYTYVVIEDDSQDVILEQTVESSPWVIFRWSVLNHEVYGRGPVLDSLPSARSLNAVVRFELEAANLNIAPPLGIDLSSGINPNTIRIEPYAKWPLNTIPGAGDAIKPIQLGGNVEFAQVTTEDLRNQINALMFADPLGPIQSPVRTATEIQLRQQNLAEEIGPAFGRLEVELLSPLIDRCVHILRKKGLFPDIRIGSKEINLKYQSPLAKSQDQRDVQSLEQVNQILQSIVGPQMSLAAYNLEKLPKWLAEKLGADQELLKDPQQIQQQAQQMAQAQAQQQQAQAAPAEAPTQGGPVAQ